MKAQLVDLLVCPRCQAPLQLTAGEVSGTEIVSGKLSCNEGHAFAILRGVPRFVEDEWYAGNFGFEWNLHHRTQLDDASSDESERTFAEKTGFTADELRGKLVLDVGCGMGRFSDVAARWGATVVGIDLSLAVDACHRNLGGRENVHVVQASVFDLPFKERAFDYIFSLGVLHHTPDTRRAFDHLPRLLKVPGKVAIWVYSTEMRKWCWTSDAYRRVTTRLPKRLLHAMSHVAVPLYHVGRLPYLGAIASVALPVSRHPKPEWRVLDTFDWYSPRYQWKHSNQEVLGWFAAHGLQDLQVLSVPTTVQGTRTG